MQDTMRFDTHQVTTDKAHTCDDTRSKVKDVRVFRAGPARNHAEPICTESEPVCACGRTLLKTFAHVCPNVGLTVEVRRACMK
jgi:hypothetical protein